MTNFERMKLFERLFRKNEYVFLIYQDVVMNDDGEKALKNEVHEYIKKSLGGWFRRQYITYVDYFTSKTTQKIFNIFCTFEPKKGNTLATALLLEIYAFTEIEDERLFADYDPEYKEFSNEFQTVKVYKLKLKKPRHG